jgi:hypothetical protein
MQQTEGANPPDLSNQPLSPAKDNGGIPNIDVQQRIAALKKRKIPTKTRAQYFDYDPGKPLHLQPNTKKCGNEEKSTFFNKLEDKE